MVLPPSFASHLHMETINPLGRASIKRQLNSIHSLQIDFQMMQKKEGNEEGENISSGSAIEMFKSSIAEPNEAVITTFHWLIPSGSRAALILSPFDRVLQLKALIRIQVAEAI